MSLTKRKKRYTKIRNTNFYHDTIVNDDDESSETVDYDSYYDFPLDLKYNKNSKHVEETTTSHTHNEALMYFTKNHRLMLINGYINFRIYGYLQRCKMAFRFSDILTLIESFYNDSIFIWQLDQQFFEEVSMNLTDDRYLYHWHSTAKQICAPSWPILFNLKIYPISKYNRGLASRNNPLQPRWRGGRLSRTQIDDEKFSDIELSLGSSNYRYGVGASAVPTFMKIYYELYCNDIHMLRFWKGVKKYRSQEYVHGRIPHDKLLIPRGFLKRAELLDQDNVCVIIKASIRFLCVQWPESMGWNDYFENIEMTQNVKFSWHISNNYNVLDNFKNKDTVLFSPNFDNDNWSLYCRNIKTPTNKKKTKFYIGLMLIKLPWYFNYVKIQLIVRCNDKDHQKEMVNKIWTGFESSLQIPFKHEFLQESSALDITVKLKILEVYDIYDRKVDTKNFINWKK